MSAFSEIPLFRYRMVMADPPWSFATYSAKGHGKSAHAQYQCMSLEEIKALPVAQIAAPDAYLWLWATNPMLRQAFEVLDAWGARFVTAGHWCKTTKGGGLAFGTGYVLRSAGEPFLIGAWGKPRVASRSIRSVVWARAREHSRKPDEAFAAAEKMIDGPRIELFSRESRLGWETWGQEACMFDLAS